MAKLGYTWYPKDWGNSESVFELSLKERGLFRELIDIAMLNDNKTIINMPVWCRKWAIKNDDLKSLLGILLIKNLIEVNGKKLFIKSCESRLNLVRGGSKGGKISKPTQKPIIKPTQKPDSNQIEKKLKEKEKENRFFKFWELYPKKVNKDGCLKKWMNLKDEEIDKIANTIKIFVSYKPFEDYTHPNPMTYFNQKRWEDEISKSDIKEEVKQVAGDPTTW